MQTETKELSAYLHDLSRDNEVACGCELEYSDTEKLKLCAERLDAQAKQIERLEAEIAIMSQKNPNGDRNPSPGDPCGRSCEGQSYRIELRQALDKAEQQAKEIGTNTIVINEQAKELDSLRAELQRRNNLDALNRRIDSYFSEN